MAFIKTQKEIRQEMIDRTIERYGIENLQEPVTMVYISPLVPIAISILVIACIATSSFIGAHPKLIANFVSNGYINSPKP